jgi:prepilin-type N-terminal cleavage/methylation domain-containing protein
VKRTIPLRPIPAQRRRGVTLVEMLVTVAVLVIIMTILVQVFQGATGALSAAQATQELDNSLKLLDATIRQDLGDPAARPCIKPRLFRVRRERIRRYSG